MKLRIAIIGASGYSGIELVRIAQQHPQVEIAHVMGSSTVGKRIDEVYPYFRKRFTKQIEPYECQRLADVDLVFLSLPHGEALKYVPELLAAGKKVIDFSGDFRFKSAQTYEAWYHVPHTAPECLVQAVFGLPELFHKEIRTCQLLANPGCYPTGAILALAPLMTKTYAACDDLAITAMSGTSGAGRKEKLELLFAEVNETVKAYRVGKHQHTPEIQGILEQVAGRALNVVFIPHLLPITRGIYTTVCLSLKEPVTQAAVVQDYQTFYQDAPFVRVLADMPPELKFVTGTNYCDIGVNIDQTGHFLVITSAIDNLMKGAAGQAVQNMNLMAGFPETEGL
jgi:N-acetyl-gamma-glutamyl-phosphate reductase